MDSRDPKVFFRVHWVGMACSVELFCICILLCFDTKLSTSVSYHVTHIETSYRSCPIRFEQPTNFPGPFVASAAVIVVLYVQQTLNSRSTNSSIQWLRFTFSSAGAMYWSLTSGRNDHGRWRVIRIVWPGSFRKIERAVVRPESPGNGRLR